jgi:hypothetical protein
LQLLLDWIDSNVEQDMETLQLVSGADGRVIFPAAYQDAASVRLIDVGVASRCALNLRSVGK